MSFKNKKPIVVESNQSIVEPLINLLQSLHIEVQYEAIELIKLLMDYAVKESIIKSLVNILKPPKRQDKPEAFDGNNNKKKHVIIILNFKF